MSNSFAFAQNSTLTIEDFHSKLHEATNFPLRPFVIPFLKVSPRALESCQSSDFFTRRA